MRKLKLSELNRKTIPEYKASEKIPVWIVLDDIRSAQNVGSIFRSADCFGIEKIFICGLSPTPPHKEISKTAIGATHSVEWDYFKEISDCLDHLKSEGIKLFAIEQTDASIHLKDMDFPDKIAIVFGNEVDGVNEKALEKMHGSIEIEQFGTKHSLNVAVCAGIVLHQLSNNYRKT